MLELEAEAGAPPPSSKPMDQVKRKRELRETAARIRSLIYPPDEPAEGPADG